MHTGVDVDVAMGVGVGVDVSVYVGVSEHACLVDVTSASHQRKFTAKCWVPGSRI